MVKNVFTHGTYDGFSRFPIDIFQKSKQNAPGVQPGAQNDKNSAAQVYLNHQPVLTERKLILD